MSTKKKRANETIEFSKMIDDEESKLQESIEDKEFVDFIQEEKEAIDNKLQDILKEEMHLIEQETKEVDQNDLDTPAFLRKQAQHELSS